MVKAIGQTIPSYVIIVFKLLITACDDIYKMHSDY